VQLYFPLLPRDHPIELVILFSVITDEGEKEEKDAGKGYRMGDKKVKIVCYVDDAVIIPADEDNLQRLLHRFELILEEYNVSISVQKI